MKENNKKAIILLSGGLDSATTAVIARSKGFLCYAITFRYGQRHSIELEAASRIASALEVAEHKIVNIDLAVFGGSALTDHDIEVPKDRDIDKTDIPITYVPARNTIFLSYALAWAEVMGIYDIFIGVNATDYSGYPDCRPEFIEAYQKMANLATAAVVQCQDRYTIHTPIIELSKAEIIQAGMKLNLDYGLTHSCYDPDAQGKPCGQCDSCKLRLKGFYEAGLTDPVEYSQP